MEKGLMKEGLYEELFRQETTLWWHVGKRELVSQELTRRLKGTGRYLDAGCGTGAMAAEMVKTFREVYGIDGSAEALKFSRKRGLTRLKKDSLESKLDFTDNYFDAVSALDVVEHVENDKGLIEEFARILRPGGILVVTVPAYPTFWSYWDDMLGHQRRYRRNSVEALVRNSGFGILKSTYFYSFLLTAVPIRWLRNLLGIRNSDFINVPPLINGFLLTAARLERWWLSFMNLPAGLSILIVAQKK